MIYHFNNYRLDTQLYQLSSDSGEVAIEPQVFDLLSYLIKNRNRLITREELFNTIWSGRVVSDTSLSNHIKSARKAIGDSGRSQTCIKTIHGRGYQFVASTDEVINHGSDLTKLSSFTVHSSPENIGPFVVVLPFQDISPESNQKFFAEGMSEDITTELSRFKDIQVIARHTAFQYNDASLNIKKVSEELDVEYLIEGSVRRTDNKIRVNVQLIDARTEMHVWAEKYDGAIDDVFSIQDEITETVVSTVSGQIRRIETERSKSRGTENLRAYDHLLRGLSYHKNGTVSHADEVKATEEFQKAIELDPNFARARAWIICSKSAMFWDLRSDDSINSAIDEGKYALALDESESETHRILGSLYLYIRNYQLAGHHYEYAQRLSPNDAHVTVKSARFYAYTDRLVEALKTVRRAMRLNPLHPGWYWQELGIVYYSMGEYADAIDSFYKNWELGGYDLAWIGACYVGQSNLEMAKTIAKKATDIEPKASVSAYTKFETYKDVSKHELLRDRMLSAGIPM